MALARRNVQGSQQHPHSSEWSTVPRPGLVSVACPREAEQGRTKHKHLPRSDALFQSRHWVSFDNCLRRLGLHHDRLSEDLPLTSFCGWLPARLDPAQAWERKLAELLHLLRRDTGEAADQYRARLLLQAVRLSEGGHQRGLGHRLSTCLRTCALHRLREHRREGECASAGGVAVRIVQLEPNGLSQNGCGL